MNLCNILLELFALDLKILFKLLDQIIYTLIERRSHAQSNACIYCQFRNVSYRKIKIPLYPKFKHDET